MTCIEAMLNQTDIHTKRKEVLKKIAKGKLAGIPRARKRRKKRGGGGAGRGQRESLGIKKQKKRESDFTEREHKVTERSNRHSGFDIPSASD